MIAIHPGLLRILLVNSVVLEELLLAPLFILQSVLVWTTNYMNSLVSDDLEQGGACRPNLLCMSFLGQLSIVNKSKCEHSRQDLCLSFPTVLAIP